MSNQEMRSLGLRRCLTCRVPRPLPSYASSTARRCNTCTQEVETRPCHRCHETKPLDAFPLGHGRGKTGRQRRSSVCRGCWEAERVERAECAAEAERRRVTFVDVTGRWVRRCHRCTRTLDLERDFYPGRRNAAGELIERTYRCKDCSNEQAAEQYQKVAADPARLARRRARGRVLQRRWRAAHPAAYRAAHQRYVARVMADATRRGRQNENARIAYRLRKERREGRALDDYRHLRSSSGPEPEMPYLPAGPLVEVVEAYVARSDGHRDDVLAGIGVDPRSLYAWRSGERQGVRFEVVDRVLTRLSLTWWDVWPPAEHPAVLAALTA